MSRVGKKPINLPDKIRISETAGLVEVEGVKGKLTRTIHPNMGLDVKDGVVQIVIRKQDKQAKALQGLTRSLVSNMVEGVSKGFERQMEISGIGYRAEVSGQDLVLTLGYSHPVRYAIPQGIKISVEKNTLLKLSGIDKEELGQIAATIRRLRPPEPYKGKGVKFSNERIQKKAGKSGAK